MLGDKVKRILKRTFVKDEGMFDYHQNGRKRKEVKWIDKNVGIKSEIWWDDCGRKEIESVLNNHGENNGLQTEWYKNGRKKTEGSYIYNLKDGLWTSWYESGRKMREVFYNSGIKEGVCTEWYENGRKKKEQFYEVNKITNEENWDIDGNQT